MYKIFNKICLILFICFFNLSYLIPSTPRTLTQGNYKTYEIEALNKKFNVSLYIMNDLLNIEFEEIDTFPIIIYESKLEINDIKKLSKKLFINETLISSLDIFIELFDGNKYSLKDNTNFEYILTMSPKKYLINDFEITLKLRVIDKIEAFRQLFLKTRELIEENKQLKKKINNNVLFITTEETPILSNLLKLNPFVNHISTIHPDLIISSFTEDKIKKFKIILYDLKDGGFIKTIYHEDIKKYLLNGGNIILTHEHWTREITCDSDIIKLIDGTFIGEQTQDVIKAKVINNSHPVFNSYYKLGLNNQQEFEISKTHKHQIIYNQEEYNKNLFIELSDNRHGEYLMIKEYGKGKIVLWNAGHTYDLKDIEKKLFMNILAWLCDN